MYYCLCAFFNLLMSIEKNNCHVKVSTGKIVTAGITCKNN